MAAGKRTSLASLAGGRVEAVPGHGEPTLTRVLLSQLATTPLNRRVTFNEGKLDELGESLRQRQIQPIVVVPAGAYLKLWPDHEDHVGTARFVIVAGERRFRAAGRAGLDSLHASIQEDLADSRIDLLDAVLAENVERENLDPIEEANAVEDLVQECGSATAAAVRFRKSEGWVSQRRSLLRLSPEIQRRVSSGEVSVRIARAVASKNLPADQQGAAVAAVLDEQAADKRRRTQTRVTTAEGQRDRPDPSAHVPAARLTPEPGRPVEPVFTAVKTDGGAGQHIGTPMIRLDNPESIAQALRRHLSPTDLRTLARLLSA